MLVKHGINPNTSDMFYARVEDPTNGKVNYVCHFLSSWGHKNFSGLKKRVLKHVSFTPCWTLTALLEILPTYIGDFSKTLICDGGYYTCTYIGADETEGNIFMMAIKETTAKNPIDAVYKMILNLKKKGLI